MSWATSEAVAVLTFLLPGFVGSAVFYSLTAHPTPNDFGRVIQALVFTALGQSSAWVIYFAWGSIWPTFEWILGLEILVSVLGAVVIAVIVAYFSNHDIAHRFLRRVGVTTETSFPSEMYSAFAQNPNCYVVLHFKDQRRLYGWPDEWPSRSGEGHFLISDCEWVVGDHRILVSGVSVMLVSADQVELVEFLEYEIIRATSE